MLHNTLRAPCHRYLCKVHPPQRISSAVYNTGEGEVERINKELSPLYITLVDCSYIIGEMRRIDTVLPMYAVISCGSFIRLQGMGNNYRIYQEPNQ